MTGDDTLEAADVCALSEITFTRLSREARYLACGVTRPLLESNLYERKVVVLDLDDPRLVAELLGRSGARWSPARDVLATWGAEAAARAIALFDPVSGDEKTVLETWPEPIEQLEWSHDGDRLLFVARLSVDLSDEEPDERRRAPRRLTRLRYREDGVGWVDRRPRQGYLLEPTSGEVRCLSRGGFDDWDFAWHPDGKRVVFVSERDDPVHRSIRNALYVQEVEGDSPPRRLTGTDHACSSPGVSPDGTLVAYLGVSVETFPALSELLTVSMSGGEATSLSENLDRDVNGPATGMGAPIWLGPDRLLVLIEDAGRISPCELTSTGEILTPPSPAPRRQTSLDARRGRRSSVLTSPTQPPALLVERDGVERLVYEPNEAFAERRRLTHPVHEQLEAPGAVLDTWLSLPDPNRFEPPYPLLVCLQGGGTQFGYHWSHELQLLAAHGFATLYLNARGSAGYGNAWQRAVCGPRSHTPGSGWGGIDVADVEVATDSALARHHELDPARLGVQGGSYGGLVTTFLLASSDRFACGWAERGPYNLVSLAGTNDESPWFFESYLGRNVLDDPGEYWARSPLSVAGRIRAPLLIVHSEEDRRCPVQQAEELFMALMLNGNTVELLRFPGEGHGLSRNGSPLHRIQRLEAMLEWFGRWLLPRERESGATPD